MTEEYVSDAFVYMRERRLPYLVFDADNHMYENRDALTKFIPAEYDGIVKYVDVHNRTKIAIKDMISDFIPNPTFARVAPPGGSEADPQSRRAIPSVDAFFDPEPRLALMKDMGIDKSIIWPTLATGVEERLASDPDAIQIVLRAFNRWMLEHWTYNYADAMYPTPMISLSVLDDALAELEFVVANGAKAFLLHTAPVPTWKGRMSFALPVFDPFWEAVQEADILVGMHQTDSGYQRYTNEWEGGGDKEFRPFAAGIPGLNGSPAFLAMASEKSAIVDGVASIIGHGVATRFPRLRFAPVEWGTEWVRPFIRRIAELFEKSPENFQEDPVEVFKRNIFVHAFQEPDPAGLAELIGVDNVMFGSDFPHREGLADPVGYSEVVEKQMSPADAAKVMGGNLARIMKVSA
ncbi:MAG: amidohydrolase 2 [Acidimicrobiales bacterium]|nr:amidohydrolase 2 [Acidimicrobiales bacterium]